MRRYRRCRRRPEDPKVLVSSPRRCRRRSGRRSRPEEE
jgi:hypothetical protein